MSIQIREFTKNDITQDYLAWLNNKFHMRFSNQRHTTHTMQSCMQFLSSFEQSNNYFLAIENSGKLVGTATLYLNLEANSFDIGLLIGEGHSEKGLGKLALKQISNLELFAIQGILTLTAGTLLENVGMQAVLEANGFLLEREETDWGQGGDLETFKYYKKSLK